MADIELVTAILTGPCCCDDCPHASACGTQLLACDAFQSYADGESQNCWEAAARSPTRKCWEALFAPAALKARRELAARERLAGALRRNAAAAKAAMIARRRFALPKTAAKQGPVTLRVAARRLKVCVDTLRDWLHEGAPQVRPGGLGRGHTALVDVVAVAAWQAAHHPKFQRRISPEERRERKRLWQLHDRARQRAQAAAVTVSSASPASAATA